MEKTSWHYKLEYGKYRRDGSKLYVQEATRYLLNKHLDSLMAGDSAESRLGGDYGDGDDGDAQQQQQQRSRRGGNKKKEKRRRSDAAGGEDYHGDGWDGDGDGEGGGVGGGGGEGGEREAGDGGGDGYNH